MSGHSVSHVAALINRQVESQQALLDCLDKATALMAVALESDFLDCTHSTIHNYLSTVDDLIHQAKLLGDDLFEVLASIDLRPCAESSQ